MKRRWVILVVIGLILVAAVLASVIYHSQLRAAREKYIAELKAKGESIDLAQLIPPPVPPDQNGAEALRKADQMFNAGHTLLSSNYSYGGMRMVAPGKAAIMTEQPVLREDYDATNSWEEVRAAVAKNADAFALLHQIIKKRNFDTGIDYAKEVDTVVFTNLLLPEAKAAAMRLGTAALSDLHEKDAGSATENVRTMLAITEGMRREHTIISGLVRIAIVAIAVPDTWEILQSPNVTDEQLAALQMDLANVEFFHSMQTAVELERASGIVTVDKWRGGDRDFDRALLNPPTIPWFERPELSALDRLRLKSRLFRWRYWWSYPDEIRELNGEEFILETWRAAQTNDALLALQQNLQTNIAKFPMPTNEESYYWFSNAMNVDLHFTLSESVPVSARTFYRVMTREMERRMAVTAIALKRYQLKHGKYPVALDALTPQFLTAIPRDLDGKALRYQRNVDGSFTLYSIGDNGVDNGGDPTPTGEHKTSLQWQFGRDWVWPQRASGKEIQQFYAHPPK
jgi:hypothetical protein